MKIGTVKSPGWNETNPVISLFTNKVTWKCNSFQCTYKFENPDKGGWWIKNFMKYVQSCEVYGKPATKRTFLRLVKKPNPIRFGEKPNHKGYMNTFFAAVKDAGIVTAKKHWNGKFTECKYSRGPNWSTYLEGRLKRG